MATTTVEKIAIELGLDPKDLKSGLKHAVSVIDKDTKKMKADFKTVSKEINRMHTGLKRMVTSLPAKLGLGGGIAGLALLTKGMISSRMEMEDFETEWTVLMGSVEAAKERLEELTDFAAATPFQLPDIVTAGKQLQNFGMYSKENLTLVGDAAAYAKKPINELSMWFGRLYDSLQSGRPAGEATMRLQELAIISGETRNKLEAMQKAGKSGQEIWETFAGSLGHLSGMMEKKSKTMGGMISNLRDLWYQFQVWVSEHVFQAIKKDIDLVLKKINEWSTSGQLKKWAEEAGKKIKGFYDLIKSVVGFISKHWDIITSLAAGILAVVAAIEAWTIVQTILNAIMTANPVGLIITGIGLLVAAINYVVKKTVGWAAVWDVVKKSVSIFWEYLKALGGLIKDWIDVHVKGFKSFGKIIAGVFTLNFDKIKEGFEELKAVPGGFVDSVVDRFSEAGDNAVDIWKKTKEKIETQVVEAKVKGVTTTEPGAAPPINEVDPAILKQQEEIARKIRDLKIQNIQDEFKQKRAAAEAWATDEIANAQRNAELIAEIREQLQIRLGAIDEAEKQKMIERQEEVSDWIMNSFGQIGDNFADALTGMEVNWGETWTRMINQWIRDVIRKIIKGIADTVAATIFGENIKRTEMLKTAATAIATAATAVAAGLKAAAVAIYNAIANMAAKLSFLGPLAIPAIAAGAMALVALMGKFKKALGLAKGARVKEPTAALIGEAGPEIVAPEKDFLTYSRELIVSFVGKLGDVLNDIRRPVIEAVEMSSMTSEIRTMSMMAAPALAGAGMPVGEIEEGGLVILKQIRDQLDALELNSETRIEGEDIYIINKLKTKEHGRKEY